MSWWASTISIDGLPFSSYAFWSSTCLFYSTLCLVCSIRATNNTWKKIQNGSFWKIKVKYNRTFINSWKPRMSAQPASKTIKFSAILCRLLRILEFKWTHFKLKINDFYFKLGKSIKGDLHFSACFMKIQLISNLLIGSSRLAKI